VSLAAASAATAGLAPDLPSRPRTGLERSAAMLEGAFLRQLLKVMRETVPESSIFGESLGQSIYTQMFDESVADEVSRGEGMGLRPILLAQLGGAAVRPPASARQAAAALRKVAALDTGPLSSDARGAARSGGGFTAAPLDGIDFSAPARPEPVRLRDPDGRLRWPVAGAPDLGATGQVQASRGAEVQATGSGQVIACGPGSLVIDHGNGLSTRYDGLGRVQTQPGDLVLRGQAVGSVGKEASFRFQVYRGRTPLAGSALAPLLGSGLEPALP
jgi:Rod binding domain-containing protein